MRCNTVRPSWSQENAALRQELNQVSIVDTSTLPQVDAKKEEEFEPATKGELDLEMVFESMIVPVMITRMNDGLFLYQNQASVDLFHFPRDGSPQFAADYYANPDERTVYKEQLQQQGEAIAVELHARDHFGQDVFTVCSTTLG